MRYAAMVILLAVAGATFALPTRVFLIDPAAGGDANWKCDANWFSWPINAARYSDSNLWLRDWVYPSFNSWLADMEANRWVTNAYFLDANLNASSGTRIALLDGTVGTAVSWTNTNLRPLLGTMRPFVLEAEPSAWVTPGKAAAQGPVFYAKATTGNVKAMRVLGMRNLEIRGVRFVAESNGTAYYAHGFEYATASAQRGASREDALFALDKCVFQSDCGTAAAQQNYSVNVVIESANADANAVYGFRVTNDMFVVEGNDGGGAYHPIEVSFVDLRTGGKTKPHSWDTVIANNTILNVSGDTAWKMSYGRSDEPNQSVDMRCLVQNNIAIGYNAAGFQTHINVGLLAGYDGNSVLPLSAVWADHDYNASSITRIKRTPHHPGKINVDANSEIIADRHNIDANNLGLTAAQFAAAVWVNPTAFNLRTAKTSPTRRAGANLSAVHADLLTDIERKPRKASGPWGMGCFRDPVTAGNMMTMGM
jgi:hypothetical protein